MDVLDYFLMWSNRKPIPLSYEKYGMSLEDFADVLLNFLDWLQLEYKRTIWVAEGRPARMKPMSLNYKYPWCQNIKKLVDEDQMFKYYFTIKGKELDFSDNISEEERNRLRKKAYLINGSIPRHIDYYRK